MPYENRVTRQWQGPPQGLGLTWRPAPRELHVSGELKALWTAEATTQDYDDALAGPEGRHLRTVGFSRDRRDDLPCSGKPTATTGAPHRSLSTLPRTGWWRSGRSSPGRRSRRPRARLRRRRTGSGWRRGSRQRSPGHRRRGGVAQTASVGLGPGGRRRSRPPAHRYPAGPDRAPARVVARNVRRAGRGQRHPGDGCDDCHLRARSRTRCHPRCPGRGAGGLPAPERARQRPGEHQ